MSSRLFKRMYILYFFTAISLLVLFPISSVTGQQLSKDFLEHFHYREIGPTRQGSRVVSFAVSEEDPF